MSNVLGKLFKKENKKTKEVRTMARGKKVETIEVKVSRSGTSFLKTVTLNGDRSVAAALKAAGIAQKEAENVLVNNEEVDNPRKYELEDGDKVVLVKDVEGGAL